MVIIAVGYLIGHIRIAGFSLGVAAVLFVGLGLAAANNDIKLPAIVYQIGLVLFVYTIGLASGPSFVASLRSRGLGRNLLTLVVIVVAAVEMWLLARAFGLGADSGGGVFAGAVTNTPALAAVVDTLGSMGIDADLGAPVVGYSLAYPFGVLLPIGAIALMSRVWKVNHQQEAIDAGVAALPLETWTVNVTATHRPSVRDVEVLFDEQLIISRIVDGPQVQVPSDEHTIESGTHINIVGTTDILAKATAELGERIETDLDLDRFNFRRIFVSNPDIVGVPLRKLQLREKHGFLLTRIRRGDIDMIPHANSVLELGDRVRVVTLREDMRTANKVLGDSYRRISEIDVLTFTIGIALGLLLGVVPIPFPGGTLTLGVAGGPLVVALVLSYLRRTGPFVWVMPYQTNLTIRQFGIVLFLAGIGTTAGEGFSSAIRDPASLLVIAAAILVSLTVSIITLVVGYKVMKIPFGESVGILASVFTQPAHLAYANDAIGTELPNRGYTTVYPLAMIAKIIVAQALVFAMV